MIYATIIALWLFAMAIILLFLRGARDDERDKP